MRTRKKGKANGRRPAKSAPRAGPPSEPVAGAQGERPAREPSQAPPPKKRPGPDPGASNAGRPRLYDREAVVPQILAELRTGKALLQICEADGMPDDSTLLGWCEEDPELSKQYARACEAGFDRLALTARAIADDASQDYKTVVDEKGKERLVFDHEHVQRSKLRVDTIKWYLAKRASKRYGDRLDVTSGDKPLAPRTTLTIFGKEIELA